MITSKKNVLNNKMLIKNWKYPLYPIFFRLASLIPEPLSFTIIISLPKFYSIIVIKVAFASREFSINSLRQEDKSIITWFAHS